MTAARRLRWQLPAVLAVAVVLAVPRTAPASGFLMYDLSAEGLGRASAVSASVREPAAAWYDPAALAFLGGVSASAGGVVVLSSTRFSPADGSAEVDARPGRFFLPTLFAAAAVTDRLHAGLAVAPAFGLGTAWPDGWVGRESAVKASLQSLTFNPNLALRLAPRLGIAAGFDATRGSVDFVTALPSVVGGQVEIGGAAWAFGWNAAVLYRPLPDRVHLALTYRSRARFDFDGRADFDPDPDFARDLPDQGGRATLPMPDIVTAGAMWRASPAVELTADVNLVRWSAYDQLTLDFDSAPDRVLRRNNHDSATVRVGADWATRHPGLRVRAGLIYDQNPSPKETLSPTLPDATRLDATIGAGLERGRFKLDAGYLFAYFLPSESTTGQEGPEGTYRSRAHLLAVTLTVRVR